MFSNYAKLKNKISICYTGSNSDYIIQLKSLRPSFESAFPELEFVFVTRTTNWMKEDKQSMNWSDYPKGCHGCEINILYDASLEVHPIFKLISESDIKVIRCPNIGKGNQYGVICHQANFPTKSLSAQEISKVKSIVEKKGLVPIMASNWDEKRKKEMANSAGLVIGVECDILFQAVYTGRPTVLVPTGLGKELYKLLAGKPELILL